MFSTQCNMPDKHENSIYPGDYPISALLTGYPDKRINTLKGLSVIRTGCPRAQEASR